MEGTRSRGAGRLCRERPQNFLGPREGGALSLFLNTMEFHPALAGADLLRCLIIPATDQVSLCNPDGGPPKGMRTCAIWPKASMRRSKI